MKALVNTVATIGAVAAGAALLEAALIPGIVIGGAAVLAPRLLPEVWPGLRRRLRPMLQSARLVEPAAAEQPKAATQSNLPATLPARFTIRQAIAKTITFRIIVTSLDFTVNYVVIGELTTAAGLSAFALVVGPLFYLAHETAWNYFGDADTRIDLTIPGVGRGFTISRALAKTITFRTIASVMDFTVNFVVVGDLATAAALSASGFILGPFVYLGHEMVWDRLGSPAPRELPAPPKLLAAPDRNYTVDNTENLSPA
jgi:uncharacterized membrane protein